MSDKELALELTKIAFKNIDCPRSIITDSYHEIYEDIINRESDSKLGKIQEVINECWKKRERSDYLNFNVYLKRIENIINDVNEEEY